MTAKRWQDWVTLVLGAWMVLSPWVYGFSADHAAMLNAVIFGAAIVVYSVIELSIPRMWEEWLMLAAGVWLLVSPWVLDFQAKSAAMWNTAVSGIVLAVLAMWALGQFSAADRQKKITQ